MKAYLKFLSRNKLYTTIEALGLIISLAFVIIIGSYVAQQLSAVYDNPNHARIYALGDEYQLDCSSCMDKDFLESRIPEIDAITRINTDYQRSCLVQDTDYQCAIFGVDKEFFDIFPQYALTEGSVEHFGEEKTAVVSQSIAAMLTENDDILGQTIVINGDEEYVICGVFKDVHNSLLEDCDVFIPYIDEKSKWEKFFENFIKNQFGDTVVIVKDTATVGMTLIEQIVDTVFMTKDTTRIIEVDGFDHPRPFSDNETVTIIRRAKGTDEKIFKDKVDEALQERHKLSCENKDQYYYDETYELDRGIIKSDAFDINNIYNYKEMFFGQAYSNIMHKGNLSNVRIFLTLVIVLLLISIVNFVNLNMALTGKRAKEMATRQLLGESKSSIIGKYLTESVLFTAICFVLALLLAYALVPMVNKLLASPWPERDIPIQLLLSPSYILAYILGVLLIGLLAGLLPALLASRYRAIETVQGTFRQHRKLWYNKIFIIVQCIVAIIFMSVVFVMEAQMQHMKNREMHCQTQDLLYFPVMGNSALVIEKLEKLPCVQEIGFSYGYPGHALQTITSQNSCGEPITIRYIKCDSVAFRLYGFEIVEDFGCQECQEFGGVWLGENAFKEGGWSDTSAFAWGPYYHQPIAGIVRDFPCYGAAEASDKYIGNVMIQTCERSPFLIVKTVGNHDEAKKQIVEILEDNCLTTADLVGYIDDFNLQELESAKHTMRLLEIFMGLSILLSLLGLVAISIYYSDESRTGIATRKVFGSTVNMELWRSVKDYMILVGIAALISAPVAYWLCDRYLSQFAYRINHFVWIILTAIVVTMLLAFLSVLWQTLRAAKTNPAEVLKKE